MLGSFGPTDLSGQETTTTDSEARSRQAPSSPWSFSLSPYLWLAGMSGNVGVNSNLPAIDVDMSFGDIFKSIDWLPPPVMVVGEVRYDRFSAFTDFIYLGLDSSDEVTRGPVTAAVDVEFNSIIWTFGGAYRVIDSDRGHLGLLAGGRLWNVDAEGSLAGPLAVRQRSGSKTWVDPIVGINGRLELGAGFAVQAEADVGGFGIASDIEWQVMGTLQYAVAESVTLAAGYRYLAVDFDDGSFLYDVALHGPIIGGTFRF
jgi:hypothetical protein